MAMGATARPRSSPVDPPICPPTSVVILDVLLWNRDGDKIIRSVRGRRPRGGGYGEGAFIGS